MWISHEAKSVQGNQHFSTNSRLLLFNKWCQAEEKNDEKCTLQWKHKANFKFCLEQKLLGKMYFDLQKNVKFRLQQISFNKGKPDIFFWYIWFLLASPCLLSVFFFSGIAYSKWIVLWCKLSACSEQKSIAVHDHTKLIQCTWRSYHFSQGLF